MQKRPGFRLAASGALSLNMLYRGNGVAKLFSR